MAKKAAVTAGAAAHTIATQGRTAEEKIRPSKHLYFRSLTVRNVRCFGDDPQTLSLATQNGDRWVPWTIIIGNNGTGKSTLLQLLDSIFISANKTSQTEFVSFDATRGASFFERVFAPNEKPENFNVEVEQHRSTAFFDFFLENIDGEVTSAVNEKAIRTSVAWYFGITHVRVGQTFQKSEVGSRRAGYGAWRRVGRSTLTADGSEQATSGSHLFDDSHELLNAEEWLQRLDYSASKRSPVSAQMRRYFKLVRASLLEILPDIENIEISPPSKEQPNPRVLFETPYGAVQLRQLGFGYQSLISWVVDFAAGMFAAYPDSPNPLAEPAVCLVDEIDLHLHPKWQRRVMKYLSERFPKTQFIATAHSPLIVQAAPEIGANVAVLRREGDHVVISNNPIDVQGWRADQILSSELFNNLPLRSPEIQSAMDERTKLLSKKKLTAKDQRRLAELEGIVADLPIGSTPDERNVAAQLKAAASLLDRVTSRKP